MATEMLQFMFLGNTNFHFHVAHFATDHATAPEIYSVFWQLVRRLREWEFTVRLMIFLHLRVYVIKIFYLSLTANLVGVLAGERGTTEGVHARLRLEGVGVPTGEGGARDGPV